MSVFLLTYHAHVVELLDADGKLLDYKPVYFKTLAGCIYCPAGQCTCDVSICVASSSVGFDVFEVHLLNQCKLHKALFHAF